MGSGPPRGLPTVDRGGVRVPDRDGAPAFPEHDERRIAEIPVADHEPVVAAVRQEVAGDEAVGVRPVALLLETLLGLDDPAEMGRAEPRGGRTPVLAVSQLQARAERRHAPLEVGGRDRPDVGQRFDRGPGRQDPPRLRRVVEQQFVHGS